VNLSPKSLFTLDFPEHFPNNSKFARWRVEPADNLGAVLYTGGRPGPRTIRSREGALTYAACPEPARNCYPRGRSGNPKTDSI